MNENDDNQLTSEDIEMLNSNDLSTSKLNAYSGEMSAYSPLDNASSVKADSLDDSFINESDTKTPGEILDDFCMKLEDVNTTLPDSVINHYMKKAGFIVNDPKLVKIVSIASQKFISEIVNDVMQHHKLKSKNATSLLPTASSTSSQSAGAKSKAANATAAASTAAAAAAAGAQNSGNVAPLTLTLEDLSQVLTEYGINVKKPYYFM